MPEILGQAVAVVILAGVVALAVRSLWKSRRTGGHCSGDCSRCGGCHHSR